MEGSSVGFERARVTALLQHAVARLDGLDAAAARREDGSFGRCEVCGGAIGEERLAALPATVRCVACVSAGARPPLRGRRPR